MLDAIIKHWEQLGGSARSSALGMDDDFISIALSESTKPKERHANTDSWRRPQRFPTGELTLSASGDYGDRLRCNWSDGRRQRLEDLIPSFIKGVLRHIENVRQNRLDRECRGRQKEQALAVREREQRLAEAESARRKGLLTMVRDHRKAQQIRAFLTEVEALSQSMEHSSETTEPRRRWLEWANWYADCIDPTKPSRTSPVVQEPIQPRYLKLDQLDLTKSTRAILTRLGIVDTNDLHQLQREDVKKEETKGSWGAWNEICIVLEGLDYDVSGRCYWM
ncbi:MAG: hypothetical protein H6818_24195 [Phycisphaerales bacterium]|nr:hypothetical protein [Phycisphaerales bacterium]